MIQLMTTVLRTSLGNQRDSKLQFNSLLMLDQLFQHLFIGSDLLHEIQLNQYQENLHGSQPSSA